MKRRKNMTIRMRPLALIVAGMVALLALGACDHSARGIYAEIEQAQDITIPNGKDNDRGTVTAMIVNGAGAEGEDDEKRYYATAKQLFWRSSAADGQDWNTIPLPAGYDIAVDIVEVDAGDDNKYLIVAMTSSETAQSALFRLNRAGATNHVLSPNVYVDNNNVPLTAQIVDLYRVDFPDSASDDSAGGHPRVFVLTADTVPERSYTLYYYHTGRDAISPNDDRLHQVWDDLSLLADAAAITSGTNSYVIFSDRTGLYCLSDTRAPDADSTSDSPSAFTRVDGDFFADGDNQFVFSALVTDATGPDRRDDDARLVGGILINDNDTVYVSGGSGQIYRFLEGSDDTMRICAPPVLTSGTLTNPWGNECPSPNSLGCWEKSNYAGDSYRYTDMIWYGNLRNDRSGLIIGIEDNGREEGGYREILAGDTVGPNGRFVASLAADAITDPSTDSNYSSSNLALTTTQSFVTDGNKLFALTSGFGLWRATYENGVPTWHVDLSR